MTQTIHILKKDLRRFGFEIGLAMLLLALYTWVEPVEWSFGFSYGIQLSPGALGVWPELWGFLLIMGWIIILIRLFQEESPAGDRQFWITRPYRWPSLLAAKVLFILAVMNVPLLVAQLVLLRLAGFSPLHYFPGVLLLHARLLGIALILIALAVISAGFRQVTWAILLFLLYLGASLWVGQQNPEAAAWRGFSIWDGVTECVLFGIPALVIMRQYWVRRTTSARLWLLGGLLAVIVLTAAMPYHRLIDHEYQPQPAGEQPLFHFDLYQDSRSSQPPEVVGGQVKVDLNLTVGKLAPGYVAELEAMEVSLEATDGTRWSSGWKPLYHLLTKERFETTSPDQIMWVGLGTDTILWIDSKSFARMRDMPLKVRVAVASSVFRDSEGTAVTRMDGEFNAPGMGICRLSPGFGTATMICRAPFHQPRLVGVTTQVFRSCPPTPTDLVTPAQMTTGWVSQDFGGSGTVLTPVSTFTPNLYLRFSNENSDRGPCPGVPLSFRAPQFLRQERVEAEFDGFKLAGGTPGKLEEKK